MKMTDKSKRKPSLPSANGPQDRARVRRELSTPLNPHITMDTWPQNGPDDKRNPPGKSLLVASIMF